MKAQTTRLKALQKKRGDQGININVFIIDDDGNILDDSGEWIPEAEYIKRHGERPPADRVITVTAGG